MIGDEFVIVQWLAAIYIVRIFYQNSGRKTGISGFDRSKCADEILLQVIVTKYRARRIDVGIVTDLCWRFYAINPKNLRPRKRGVTPCGDLKTSIHFTLA